MTVELGAKLTNNEYTVLPDTSDPKYSFDFRIAFRKPLPEEFVIKLVNPTIGVSLPAPVALNGETKAGLSSVLAVTGLIEKIPKSTRSVPVLSIAKAG